MRPQTLIVSLIDVGLLCATAAHADSIAERYMLEGKLAAGEKAALDHLKTHPDDDQARFGLGATQFLMTFEHIGASLYKHGLRSERALPGLSRQLRDLLPQKADPDELSYQDVRKALQTFLDDLEKAEATLANVKDPEVKLPLHLGLIKIDPFGLGVPINADFILSRTGINSPWNTEETVVVFDRGDVDWLRGYCHFLSAWGEALLAVDGQEMFDCTAHLFFEKVATPHAFLQEEERDLEQRFRRWDPALFSDVIAFIHLTRFPMKEPHRMKASLAHLEAMMVHSREMWKHYQTETDDDNEWIPNPRQKGVMRVPVTQERVDTWLTTVNETEKILQGKKLLPFWRGTNKNLGVNLRRAFTEPRAIDPILWVQGTAATPYLEEGPITDFANPRTLTQINRTFGGANFFGFAFWFN